MEEKGEMMSSFEREREREPRWKKELVAKVNEERKRREF